MSSKNYSSVKRQLLYRNCMIEVEYKKEKEIRLKDGTLVKRQVTTIYFRERAHPLPFKK